MGHLNDYVTLHVLLTGEKPKVIQLTPDFYTWYIQETNRIADTLNLNLGYKNNEMLFNGIPIEKKVKIVTK